MSDNQATEEKQPNKRSLGALDYLSMFIGDVIGGIGPYLAAYLRAARHWDQASIGAALSAMGIATIIAQTPSGALIDKSHQKRLLLCISAAVMSLSCIAIAVFNQFHAVLGAQILYGVGAAIAGPCTVAISLGVVGHKNFAPRIARNEAFNHVGNVMAALLAGLAGYLISPNCIFYLVALFGVASIVATAFIREQDIDHELARGARFDSESREPVSMSVLLSDKRILAFSVAVVLFHLANAAMLPLAGQYLSEARPKEAPVWISACIIAAQFVMIPVSIMAGRLAQSWGRKPVFLIGFGVLPIRGLLYTLSNSPLLVVPVQLLDGVGAGIFGVLASVIVADLTKGTGHYNITRGLIITAQGIGAALSNILAGWIVHTSGYSAGFVSLALIAFVGLQICYFGLPETKEKIEHNSWAEAENNVIDKRIERLERELESVRQQNTGEDADQDWKDSWVRTATICGIIYIVAAAVLYVTGFQRFWLGALIPALGFYVFNAALPTIKKWWIDSR